MSLSHKTRPTQSSRSLRSSRLRLGCTRSKSLFPWLGSWVGCQALFHVPNHLCRTCGSNSCHSEWRGSQRTQAQGTHLQTTGGIRSAPAQGSPGKRQPVQDPVCSCGQGSDTAMVHVVADASPFGLGAILCSHRSWFLRRVGLQSSGSGTWRDSVHRRGDPAFQSGWELLALFFSVLVFSDLVSASRCQALACVLQQGCLLGCSVPVKATRCAHGCACRRDCSGVGKFRHGTRSSQSTSWHEQQIRRRRSVKQQLFLRCWTTCRVC